jgi:hypothetical protein
VDVFCCGSRHESKGSHRNFFTKIVAFVATNFPHYGGMNETEIFLSWMVGIDTA